MSWTELEPFVRSGARCRASTTKLKSGQWKITLFFSAAFFREMKEPKTLDVLAGSGANLGKLLMRPGKNGKFAVTALMRGSARLGAVPYFHGIPEKEFDTTPCTVEALGDGTFVVGLPLAQWAASAGARPAAAPPAATAIAPAPKPTNGAGPAEKLKALDYLLSKGHEANRARGGGIIIDGENRTAMDTLTIINGHRRRADLPLLKLGDVEF